MAIAATLINCEGKYMAKENVASKAAGLLDGFLEKEGYSLYHCEYTKEGKDRYLKVYIDKDEGYVGTDDCEKVSRYLSDRLDETDLIAQNYYLVVSSPGLDRELITQEHFDRYTGSDVDVSLYRAIDGSKELSGELVSRTKDEIVLKIDGKEICLPAKDAARVRLAVKI